MIFLKSCKFPVCLLLDKRGPEIMFADYAAGKQAVLDYENIDFTQWPY